MFTRSIRSVALAAAAALVLAFANPVSAEARPRRNDAAALAFMGLTIGTIAAIAAAEAHRRDRVYIHRHADGPRPHWNHRQQRRHWR